MIISQKRKRCTFFFFLNLIYKKRKKYINLVSVILIMHTWCIKIVLQIRMSYLEDGMFVWNINAILDDRIKEF